MDDIEVSSLSESEALALTDLINTTQQNHWSALAQAHEGKAWIALGLPSFNAYIDAKLTIKRSQAYNILKAHGVKVAIEKHLPAGVVLPDVGPTAYVGATVEDAPRIAKEFAANPEMSVRELRKTIRGSAVSAAADAGGDRVVGGIATEIDLTMQDDDLPPWFQKLADSISMGERWVEVDIIDLYRGWDVLVDSMERLVALLELLERRAPEFFDDSPEQGA